jgi:hypothetical protein
MEHSALLVAFGEFVADARRLHLGSAVAGGGFGKFIQQAKPLLAVPARRRWNSIAGVLHAIRPWYTDYDLIARIAHLEDSYTELIAWALDPETHPPSAEDRQREWLSAIGIKWLGGAAAKPLTQVWTKDGVPDLVLRLRRQVVVVEVKTWTNEHDAPSGKPQTEAYRDSVVQQFQVKADQLVHVVFLTRDRSQAANPLAICTSFSDLALALAKALSRFDLAEDVRFAFKTLITHLATFDHDELAKVIRWTDPPDDDLLFEHIAELQRISKHLLWRDDV